MMCGWMMCLCAWVDDVCVCAWVDDCVCVCMGG